MAKVKQESKSSNLLDVYYGNPPAYMRHKLHNRNLGFVQLLFDNRYGWFYRIGLEGQRVHMSHGKNWQEACDHLEQLYIMEYIAQ